MEKRIKEYLSQTSKGLNGQIRGAINKRAREENLQLIRITLNNAFDIGYGLGKSIKEEKEILGKLKKDLNITNNKEDGKNTISGTGK